MVAAAAVAVVAAVAAAVQFGSVLVNTFLAALRILLILSILEDLHHAIRQISMRLMIL